MESTPPPSTSPELDAESENDRFRLLLEQYRSEIQEFSIHEFYHYLATLQQDPAQANKYEDLVFIGKHALDHMVMAAVPVNDDPEPADDDGDELPVYSIEHFPREVFMEYTKQTPTFNVGDIVYMYQHDETKPDPHVFEQVVIVSVIVDVFGIYYNVAPYLPAETFCSMYPFLVDEEDLAYQQATLDPRRKRFEVVQ